MAVEEKWLSASAQHSSECMEILCAVYALLKQGVHDKLDRVDQGATKMDMNWSSWPIRRNWSSLTQEKTPSSGPAPNVLEELTVKMKPCCSSRQMEGGLEKNGLQWNRRPSHFVSGKIFSLWIQPSSSTACQGSLCTFHSCRFSRQDRIKSWTTWCDLIDDPFGSEKLD